MIMRSIPPASAHFALRPVPAPPPMIGCPSEIFFRKVSRICLRDKEKLDDITLASGPNQFEKSLRGRLRETRIVDVLLADLDAHLGASGQTGTKRAEERLVRLR